MSTLISRNAPCSCGSGEKYKRCCLARDDSRMREGLIVDAVARGIQVWSATRFAAELAVAVDLYVGSEHLMPDDEVMLFTTWFHNDRQLASGGTPAEHYAARADLPTDERAVASRIAAAQLGFYRVLSAEPGRSLRLENVVNCARVEVASPRVSHEAVRWDILLARVMDGDPPSIWGPVRFFEPCDEPELRAELERLAGAPIDQLDKAGLAATYRLHAMELMNFTPERQRAEPSLFTLEGDPLAFASARWRVHDHPAAAELLADLGGLLPYDPIELELSVPRGQLVARRPALPPGAILVEATPVDAPDSVPIATLRLEDGQLHAEAISEPRLEYVIELVAADLGRLVELVERNVTSADEALDKRHTGPDPVTALPESLDADEYQLLGDLVSDRMQRWLDEPHPLLDGRTPREARAGTSRDEVARLIRQLENGAERARRRGEPAADVAKLRRELDLRDEFAA